MAENIEETSYDILEWFPILFCQEVFKYLDGKDVIQASAVSKEWYKFTGERKQLKKVKLVFNRNQHRLSEEDIAILRSSTRNYQHIELKYIPYHCSEFVLEILAKHTGSWKSVKLTSCEMESPGMWSYILQAIEPSVEELSIDVSLHIKLEEIIPQWNFPHLKALKCIDKNFNIFKYFIRCFTLVKFDWFVYKQITPAMEFAIQTMLRKNRNLKELGTEPYEALLPHSTEVQFKLQKLRIELYKIRTIPDNLRLLLQAQAHSLESLTLKVRVNQACLGLILSSLPKLSSFTTCMPGIMQALSDWGPAVPMNKTITSLELTDTRHEHFLPTVVQFQTLIKALQSLKHYKCRELTEQTLLSLSRDVPALKSLETYVFDLTRFPEGNFFPNIGKFKAELYHRDMPEPTQENKFAALVAEDMRSHSKRFAANCRFKENCSICQKMCSPRHNPQRSSLLDFN